MGTKKTIKKENSESLNSDEEDMSSNSNSMKDSKMVNSKVKKEPNTIKEANVGSKKNKPIKQTIEVEDLSSDKEEDAPKVSTRSSSRIATSTTTTNTPKADSTKKDTQVALPGTSKEDEKPKDGSGDNAIKKLMNVFMDQESSDSFSASKSLQILTQFKSLYMQMKQMPQDKLKKQVKKGVVLKSVRKIYLKTS